MALYDYTAGNAGELTFKVGDVLYVLSEVKEGWYSATFNGMKLSLIVLFYQKYCPPNKQQIGQTGYAPSNYLQAQENQADQSAAKRARREKMMAERKVLRERVEAKRAQRKQLEEEVRILEEVRMLSPFTETMF